MDQNREKEKEGREKEGGRQKRRSWWERRREEGEGARESMSELCR